MIRDMARSATRSEVGDEVAPFLDQLSASPFVRAAEAVEQEPALGSRRFDAMVRAIAVAARDLSMRKRKMLLFARYIPQPTAQRLMDAGVAVVDFAGNVHLQLPPLPLDSCRKPRDAERRSRAYRNASHASAPIHYCGASRFCGKDSARARQPRSSIHRPRCSTPPTVRSERSSTRRVSSS
jgi:hypothetical protein